MRTLLVLNDDEGGKDVEEPEDDTGFGEGVYRTSIGGYHNKGRLSVWVNFSIKIRVLC